MRFIDIHETRAHALGGRIMRDLGDSVLLHAPHDRDPFFNRVAAVRWPESPGAFDHRLAEVMALFIGLDRGPHIWTASAFNTPQDLGARLAAHGFRDAGGGYVMLLVRPASDEPLRVAAGITIERLSGGPGVAIRYGAVREIAGVLAESFGLEADRLDAIEAETAATFGSRAFHVSIVRLGGEAVAVGKRYTFDGASYLSSIGTRPSLRGRGFGSLVTEALVRDSVATGSRHVYLGVRTENDRAISIYRQAGFEIVGERTGDFLLV